MRTALVTWLALVVLGALAGAREPQREASKATSGKLWAAIGVNETVHDPDEFTVRRFLLQFALVNDGDQTVDTGAGESQLIVNGKVLENREWLAAAAPAPVGGIGRPGSALPTHQELTKAVFSFSTSDGWDRLRPGEIAEAGLPAEKLFAQPGTYRVSWRGKTFESPEIVFRVLPRPAPPAHETRHPLAMAGRANRIEPAPAISLARAAAVVGPGRLWSAVSVNRLVVYPDAITGNYRFSMDFELMNDGDQVVETGASDSVLIVNGKLHDSHAWRLALANGLRDGGWHQLPPGKSTGVVFPMGRFFQEPGVYRVSWKGKSFESPEIVFRMLPRKQS